MMSTPAVTLGVDQATSSGWCIHVGTRPVAHGALNVWDFNARDRVVWCALEHCNPEGLPSPADGPKRTAWFQFVYEDHSKAPLRSYKGTPQVLALGGALWLWLDTLNRRRHPAALRGGLTSRAWRKEVLGMKRVEKSAESKSQALVWAQDYTGKQGLGEDESEAIAVSACGAREMSLKGEPVCR